MSTIEELRKMNASQLEKRNKDELVEAILSDPTNAILKKLEEIEMKQDDTNTQLREFSVEITSLRTECRELKDSHEALQEEVNALKAHMKLKDEENEKLYKILGNQQIFLEKMDAHDRQKNVVITGLPEGPDVLGPDDQGKVATVLQAIECTASVNDLQLKRFGRVSEGNIRPLLVVFPSRELRDDATSKANKLKGNQSPNKEKLQKIFLKKDRHPVWRTEYNRIYKVIRDERNRPENQGTEIRYDRQTRAVTRDGVVIDRFNPFF